MKIGYYLKRSAVYFRQLVNLSAHIDKQAAETNIRNNIEFRGPNVYILIFAIIIASLGLNVNSIPVIIGAMLISPLMGPIIGIGLSLGNNDTTLLKKSLVNLGVMVVISLLASTIYFILTPLDLAHPTELLARTNPTIYDVLIALFGGFAGILETARKEKGTVLSGVAIATALMPPLCTVGYGIASLNWQYAIGALYLFSINSVFIALATWLAVKYMHFPSVQVDNERVLKHRKRITGIGIVIMLIPSVFSAITIVKDNNFSQTAQKLITENKTIGKSYIYDYKVNTDQRPATIELYMAGELLDDAQRTLIYERAEDYGLTRQQLIFHEDAVTNSDITKQELVKDILEQNEQNIIRKESEIDSLRQVIQTISEKELPTAQLAREIYTQYPQIDHITIARGAGIEKDSTNTSQSQIIVLLTSDNSENFSAEDEQKLLQWLKVRLNHENIIIK